MLCIGMNCLGVLRTKYTPFHEGHHDYQHYVGGSVVESIPTVIMVIFDNSEDPL